MASTTSQGGGSGATPNRDSPSQARTVLVTHPTYEASQPLLGLARGLVASSDESEACGRGELLASSESCDAYLWVSRSDLQIAREIEHTLGNFEILERECDDLFRMCCAPYKSDGLLDEEYEPFSQVRIPTKRLRDVTQTLIDKLGCRSEPVLENISHIFGAAVGGDPGVGLGLVEFRGYVAAVLTQIHRELEERNWKADTHNATAPVT